MNTRKFTSGIGLLFAVAIIFAFIGALALASPPGAKAKPKMANVTSVTTVSATTDVADVPGVTGVEQLAPATENRKEIITDSNLFVIRGNAPPPGRFYQRHVVIGTSDAEFKAWCS